MNADHLAIVERVRFALEALRQGRPGASVQCEQVLTHDIAPLIARIRYLESAISAASTPDPRP